MKKSSSEVVLRHTSLIHCSNNTPIQMLQINYSYMKDVEKKKMEMLRSSQEVQPELSGRKNPKRFSNNNAPEIRLITEYTTIEQTSHTSPSFHLLFLQHNRLVLSLDFQSAVQLCSTISRTLRLYSRLFSLNSRAASEFAGEFGFGSQSSDW